MFRRDSQESTTLPKTDLLLRRAFPFSIQASWKEMQKRLREGINGTTLPPAPLLFRFISFEI